MLCVDTLRRATLEEVLNSQWLATTTTAITTSTTQTKPTTPTIATATTTTTAPTTATTLHGLRWSATFDSTIIEALKVMIIS